MLCTDAIDSDRQNRVVLRQLPTDPRFNEPLSGLYWQISTDRGDLLRSRLLWDTTLVVPGDEPFPGEAHRHRVRGPGDTHLFLMERGIHLTVGDQRVGVGA
jgi:hypothetical protein